MSGNKTGNIFDAFAKYVTADDGQQQPGGGRSRRGAGPPPPLPQGGTGAPRQARPPRPQAPRVGPRAGGAGPAQAVREAPAEPLEQNVQTLVDMGFPRQRVVAALGQCGNDIQSAAQVLLRGDSGI